MNMNDWLRFMTLNVQPYVGMEYQNPLACILPLYGFLPCSRYAVAPSSCLRRACQLPAPPGSSASQHSSADYPGTWGSSCQLRASRAGARTGTASAG